MSVTQSSQPANVSHLQSHVGFWLRFVSNHVSQAFALKLEATGVTVAEWVVLRQLYGSEPMAPSDLAASLGLTRGAVSKLVERLVAKRLVSRRDRSDDRRYQSIALTAAGTRIVPSLAALADRNDEQFFSPLTAAEREALVATLQKLVAVHNLTHIPTE